MTSPHQRGRAAISMVLASTAALTFPLACSSGLDSDVSCSATPVGSASGNVTTGLFWGFDL